MKTRRVGTFTTGIALVLFGVMLGISAFVQSIDLSIIFKLWPFVVLSFGVEVLVFAFLNKEDKFRYDGASIFLLVFVVLSSMGMAIVERILQLVEMHWVI